MSASAATSTSPPASGITARQLTPAQCAFAEDEPHYWCGDSAADTEYFHAYSVLFPEGENFFVRAVLAYNRHPAVEGNPALRDAVKGFVSQVTSLFSACWIGLFSFLIRSINCTATQEIHHAAAHIRYNKIVAGRFNHDMEGVSR